MKLRNAVHLNTDDRSTEWQEATNVSSLRKSLLSGWRIIKHTQGQARDFDDWTKRTGNSYPKNVSNAPFFALSDSCKDSAWQEVRYKEPIISPASLVQVGVYVTI